MKYECDLIRDVAVLYHDRALSPKSEQIVTDHLAECAPCRAYYGQLDESGIPAPAGQPEPAADFTRKVRRYRTGQLALFGLTVLAVLTTLLPWFGYSGVAEIPGTVLLHHPAALAGLALFLFAIWYHFQKHAARLTCGCTGWGLLLAMEVLDFLTVPQGSTTGITIGMFSYDVPNFSGINLMESLQYTLPGFYIGLAATLLCGIGFLVFARETSRSL